jgi:DNA-binding response OmpR family regulator
MENKKTILVVEDEVSLNNVITTMLSKAEFNVLNALNGKEGLEKALKEHPDLILLDLLMPIMDGMTMLTKLKQDTWGQTVPVFILTNHGDVEKATQAIQAGAYAYFIKSNWHLSDVVEKIKTKLAADPKPVTYEQPLSV